MARLKKDHTGYRSSGLWLKYQPVGEKPAKRIKRKDTRKWCRGKEGVKHDYKLLKRTEFMSFVWTLNKCINCGKKEYS